MAGGSTTEIYQPSPPPQPSTTEAVQAWADAMPQVYETQMQYAPLQAQQQVELAQQYAQPLGEAYQQAQQAMNPETFALQEQLAGQAGEGMEQGLSDVEREQYFSDISGALGTNVGSPIGAEFTGRSMLLADQARKDYFRNLGLSVAGRQPLAQPQTPGTSNYMGGFTPGQSMNFMASTYAPFVQGSQPMMMQNQQPNYLGGIGSILGGIGGMATGGMFGGG